VEIHKQVDACTVLSDSMENEGDFCMQHAGSRVTSET
jgi:hypothetical protein